LGEKKGAIRILGGKTEKKGCHSGGRKQDDFVNHLTGTSTKGVAPDSRMRLGALYGD